MSEKRLSRWLFYLIVFLSGMTTLIYEIVFARKVSMIFGSTIYSMSTVISAFLIGFSVGALVYNRRFKGAANPFKVLFVCQVVVVASSVLFLYSQDILYRLFFLLFEVFGSSFHLFVIAKSLVLGLLLMIPTTAFGLFFVTACHTYMAGRQDVAVGNVYSASNFGSVAGSWGSGFILVPMLGLNASILLAVAVNGVLAVALLWLWKRG